MLPFASLPLRVPVVLPPPPLPPLPPPLPPLFVPPRSPPSPHPSPPLARNVRNENECISDSDKYRSDSVASRDPRSPLHHFSPNFTGSWFQLTATIVFEFISSRQTFAFNAPSLNSSYPIFPLISHRSLFLSFQNSHSTDVVTDRERPFLLQISHIFSCSLTLSL